MTNSDYFEIFLFGNSGGADGLPITANAPLTLDNFRVGVVPEPYSAYLLAYGVLSAVALQRLRG